MDIVPEERKVQMPETSKRGITDIMAQLRKRQKSLKSEKHTKDDVDIELSDKKSSEKFLSITFQLSAAISKENSALINGKTLLTRLSLYGGEWIKYKSCTR